MRLMTARFDYVPDRGGIKVCQPGKTKALARIVPDSKYPDMWRVVRPDGSLIDQLNIVRAKDMAFGLAETAMYLGKAA